jgi:hypothetical protein
MTRHPSPAFENFLNEVAAQESSRILVTIDGGKSNHFKIYVDGNIRVTPPRLAHLRTKNTEVVSVQPGEHRVVIREAEVSKSPRAESNTVVVSLSENEEAHLVLRIDANALSLLLKDGI